MQVEPFAIERWFARYEFKAQYNLAESCVQPFTLDELLALTGTSLREIERQGLGYGESNGSFELRQTIAELYPGTTAANILVTVGAIEANFLALNSLIKPGDTVITEFPAYQQLYSIPEGVGARVKRWVLKENEGYEPNIDDLCRLLDDRTRLVVINHPHNPTGKAISTKKLLEIAQIVHDAGAVLYSDEVYHGLTLKDRDPSPTAWNIGFRSVVIGSMSKAYGLSGLRIGWIVADEEFIEQCWSLRDYTSICPSPLAEKLATVALRHCDLVLERSRTIARRNLALVREWLQSLDGLITWREPDEGVIGFPKLHFTSDSAAFCERLMNELGVLLVPGSCFECPGHIRLGFGYDTGRLERGLALVSDYLRRHYL